MLKKFIKVNILLMVISLSSYAESSSNSDNHNSNTSVAQTQTSDWFTNWFKSIFLKKDLNLKQLPEPENSDGKTETAEYVIVNKSERKMYLKKNGMVIKTFNIALGTEPSGKKTFEGDLKTPEGLYRLGYKNANSTYYKSIYISYPNNNDKINATKYGKRPGSAIVVHGMPNKWNVKDLIRRRGKDWTEGCIALSNNDMDQFWYMIKKPGTFIKINP